jgi:hypothetical protein
MSSQAKKDSARRNGAKSRGPVTPEGRARSSANSLRHGLTASNVVLHGESREDFDLLLADYVDQFRPATRVEMELIESMAVARWRLRRLLGIENNMLRVEMSRRAEEIDDEFQALDEAGRLAWVFQKMADQSTSLELIIRYEAATNRSYDRAFKQLILLRSGQPAAPAPAGLGSFRNSGFAARPQPREPRPIASFAVEPNRPALTPPLELPQHTSDRPLKP